VRLYVFLLVVYNRAHHNRGLSALAIGRAIREGIKVGSAVAEVIGGPPYRKGDKSRAQHALGFAASTR
jgi:hypothetical protein